MRNPMLTAQLLAQLDNCMRMPQSSRRAIAARMRFYETAIRTYAVRRLNSLGELVPTAQLSERSLDVIFEDSRYAEAVRAGVARIAQRDPDFRAAVIEQEGALWLTQCGRSDPQLALTGF